MAAGALDTPVAMENYKISDIIPDEVQDRLLEIGYTLDELSEGTHEVVTQERCILIENMLQDLKKELEEQFSFYANDNEKD